MIFFVIVIVSLVIFSVWKDGQKKRDVVFTTAARKLDLNLSIEGLVIRKHWLSGIKGKFRIDAGPYPNPDGGKQRTHMGYRVTFSDPLTLTEAGRESSRSRLIAGFPGLYQECEVDREGIFFARADVPTDGSVVSADIERLLCEAERLVAAAGESADSGVFVVPVPESAREIRRESAATPALPPPLPERTPESDADPDTTAPEMTDTVFEPDEPEPDSVGSAPVLTTPLVEDPDEPTTLDLTLLDLFSGGRNRYETGKRFESDHRGKAVAGNGTLRKVEHYSHDRVFGRGPGRIALVEVRLAALDDSAPVSATLCAEIPDDESPSDLVGKRVELAGTLIGCDPFSSRVYLTASMLDETA